MWPLQGFEIHFQKLIWLPHCFIKAIKSVYLAWFISPDRLSYTFQHAFPPPALCAGMYLFFFFSSSLPVLLQFILWGHVLNATFCVKSLHPTSLERITPLCTLTKPGYQSEHHHKMFHWSDLSCEPFQAKDHDLHICVYVSTTIAVNATVSVLCNCLLSE